MALSKMMLCHMHDGTTHQVNKSTLGILWLLVVELKALPITASRAALDLSKARDLINLLRIEPSNLDVPGLFHMDGPFFKFKRLPLSGFVCNIYQSGRAQSDFPVIGIILEELGPEYVS